MANAPEDQKTQGFEEAVRPHYHGHRDRLRQRFKSVGHESLADYEILELLLFRSIRQADTKPIAKALIDQFGSLAGVLGAEEKALIKVQGVGPTIAHDLKVVHAASHRAKRSDLFEKTVLGSWSAVIEYCTTVMAHEQIEQFRVLFLDKKNALIADEKQQQGTVDHTPVYPREVIKKALEYNATALILVHNHPSGDPTPSKADIDMTNIIIESAAPMGITVHDHIIIGKEGHVSMRGLQLI